MFRVAEEITGNKISKKEAIIKATQCFWKEKRIVWNYRYDMVIAWEKEQNIIKKMKRKHSNIKTNSRFKTTTEQRKIAEAFSTIFIELTNKAVTNIIDNRI